MKNEEFLLKALNQLLEVWPDAIEIIKNIETNSYDENTIEYLAEQLRESINEVSDEETKEKMKRGLDVINEIGKLEEYDKKEDKKQLEKIENMLDEL